MKVYKNIKNISNIEIISMVQVINDNKKILPSRPDNIFRDKNYNNFWNFFREKKEM